MDDGTVRNRVHLEPPARGDVRAEFVRRRLLRVVSAVVAALLLSGLILSGWIRTFLGFGVMIATLFMFSYAILAWRCPSCDGALGANLLAAYCPRCGVALR